MTRVHVICEGQTEETFIKELLAKQFESKETYCETIPKLPKTAQWPASGVQSKH